jgi:hypothetical protein
VCRLVEVDPEAGGSLRGSYQGWRDLGREWKL